MCQSISIAHAKTHLSTCVRKVEGGESIVLTRHGKPVAALVSPEDLDQLKRLRRAGPDAGLAGLAGGWEDSQELVDEVLRGVRTPPRHPDPLD